MTTSILSLVAFGQVESYSYNFVLFHIVRALVFPHTVGNSANISISCVIFHHRVVISAIFLDILFNIIRNTTMNTSL